MKNERNRICPTCQGKKYLEGNCECNMEWRGNQKGDDWEDCRCTPKLECSACSGTGYLKTGPTR
ncbi:MAG: ankyrin [Proteobacteria bacterium]|nr:ankyrin [Pseudomonadota bacterium]MBU1737795.1 ankyrin [Pseudomonadota bacterium]